MKKEKTKKKAIKRKRTNDEKQSNDFFELKACPKIFSSC